MREGCIEVYKGERAWYLRDKLHREDGPAIECANGTKAWCLNGQRHREDGPAIEWADGTKEWYLNGTEYLKDSYWREVFRRGLIDNKRLLLELL